VLCYKIMVIFLSFSIACFLSLAWALAAFLASSTFRLMSIELESLRWKFVEMLLAGNVR